MSDLINGDLYIGTKLIVGECMTRQEYSDFRRWDLPEDEKHLADEEGMLVEYEDTNHPNVEGGKGYVSWYPLNVFAEAYKASGEFSFGSALELMKRGFKVARMGWNGKGMWIAISTGNKELESIFFWNKHSKKFAEDNGGYAPVLDTVIMKTAKDEVLMGWLASQTDMLAEDWMIVE